MLYNSNIRFDLQIDMQDNFENINDPIDLNVKELFTILWNKKILIASVTLTFASYFCCLLFNSSKYI